MKIEARGLPSQESRLQSLQQAAPKGLQEKMREASARLEGERKPITILFADVVGSTSIAEKLDPEEWREVVGGVHRRVGEAVYRYEGTVAQLLGDGVLAFFGAPITHEDDPIRAVRAALDLQESIGEFSRELSGLVDELQMRVGINTGEVVIGGIGTDLHVEYLALGDAVNTAARLESAAEAGSILISGRCARLIGDDFALKDLGEIAVKGKSESIRAFEVLEMKGIPALRRGIMAEGIPYMGRARELEKLRSCVQALCAGQGGIAALLGEAGIGKSRLLEEVRRSICEGGMTLEDARLPPASIRWLVGRALSYGGSLSYWMITQLLLTDLGLSDGVPELRIKVALRRRLKELFGEDSRQPFVYLARLLGLSEDAETKEHILSMDAESVKRHTLSALQHYFRQGAKRQPTVLVLEDLHWADPSSMAVIEDLMALTDRAPLLIIMLMRIEGGHGSWRLKLIAQTDYPHRYTELPLERLPEYEADELMGHLLGGGILPDRIRDLIRTRSEGNPLYLEEVAYHLVEDGLIERVDRGWQAAEAIEEAGIPETLQGVLLARIDRLGEGARRTLQMASVIGKSFLYRILEAVSEEERELDGHLSQLQRVDLVRQKARLPELEYMFKHSLTQEAAYSSLLGERRREFHRRVGEAVESLFPERREEFLGILAHHFEAAASLEKARNYLLSAGDQARLNYANEEAIEFYRRALPVLEELGEDETAVKVLMKLGLTCHSAFQFEAAREAYDRAFSLGKALGQIKDRPSQAYSPHPLRFDLPGISSLDPSVAYDVTSYIIIEELFRGLLSLDLELNVHPDVAQSWEVLDGGKRYVFHLRQDVRWSDGEMVKASDFEFAWKRILNPENRSALAMYMYDIENAQAYHGGEIHDPSAVGIIAENDHTLVVLLEESCSYFMYLLTVPVTYPVPEHIVRLNPEGWVAAEQIIGNGPYLLRSLEPGKRLVLQRNPGYYGEVSGNAQEIVVNLDCDLPDSTRPLERYMNDEADILILPSILIGEAKVHYRRLHEEYLSIPELGTVYFGFNVRRPPFNDQRVRMAFALALDKSTIADVILEGLDYPATGGFVPPGLQAYSEGIGISFSPDQARKLFREAGYTSKVEFPVIEGIGPQPTSGILEYAQGQWKDILGVEVCWREVAWPTLVKQIDESPPDVFLMSWTADYPDADNFLRTAIWPTETGWCNERFESLVKEARRIPDQDKRIDIYREAEGILMQEVPIMPLIYGRNHYLIKPWISATPLYSPFAVPNLEDIVISAH
jgi:ABC-type oligopeptide transport system substrate-binding subunit/class 3 adenylate cyclase